MLSDGELWFGRGVVAHLTEGPSLELMNLTDTGFLQVSMRFFRTHLHAFQTEIDCSDVDRTGLFFYVSTSCPMIMLKSHKIHTHKFKYNYSFMSMTSDYRVVCSYVNKRYNEYSSSILLIIYNVTSDDTCSIEIKLPRLDNPFKLKSYY